MNGRLNYRFVVSALTIGILGWAIPASAAEPGLSIVQKEAKLSRNVCIDNAAQVMRERKFGNIKVIDRQVYGSVQNYTVAILCYPTSGEWFLQSIIVSGSSGEEAEKLRNMLEQGLFSLQNAGSPPIPESGGEINQNAVQTNVQEGLDNRGTYSPRSLPGKPTTFPRIP